MACNMSKRPDGVAIVTLASPPVNALGAAVLRSLFDCLRAAHADASVRAIVITGAGRNFSAGADIKSFAAGAPLDPTVNDKFNSLVEAGPKPTVAAITGVALGGGCELAMSCNARVAAADAKMGLPELQLGIIPGFGGTQRLPRLVGVETAVRMMLTSKPISGKEALKKGLVDAVEAADKVLEAAQRLALALAAGTHRRMQSLTRSDRIEDFGIAMAVVEMAQQQAAKQARGLAHPQLCLDAVQAGIERGGHAGLQTEAECFVRAASMPVHKALVWTFLGQRATQRVTGITDGNLKPRPVKTVAVLGGGLMGSGIATATLVAGMDVVLKEVNQKFLDAGIGRIQSNLQTMAKKRRIPEAAAKAAAGRLRGTLSYDSFDSVDLVIEAAIENLKIKQQIFADLERACRKDAILSTNTSTINIELVGAKTQAADRIIGAHFFSPAHLMPLLEIVRSDKTSPQVVLDVMKYGQRIKKTCVVVGNCTGFCVNRVFAPYTQAACILLDAGMDPYLIDKAIAGFGMPMGPFRLSDLVGADIGFHVGKNFLDEKPQQFYPAAIFKLMVDHNMLGEKTPSGGFYSFEKNKRAGTPNPKIKPLIEEARKAAKVPPADQLGLSPKEVADFIMFPVINEACRVVEEGFVDKPSDCDISAVLGMGFPAWRGGPLKHGDAVGAKTVLAKLQKWEAAFASSGHGGFFTPCKYLKDRAAAGVELCSTEERSKL